MNKVLPLSFGWYPRARIAISIFYVHHQIQKYNARSEQIGEVVFQAMANDTMLAIKGSRSYQLTRGELSLKLN